MMSATEPSVLFQAKVRLWVSLTRGHIWQILEWMPCLWHYCLILFYHSKGLFYLFQNTLFKANIWQWGYFVRLHQYNELFPLFYTVGPYEAFYTIAVYAYKMQILYWIWVWYRKVSSQLLQALQTKCTDYYRRANT